MWQLLILFRDQLIRTWLFEVCANVTFVLSCMVSGITWKQEPRSLRLCVWQDWSSIFRSFILLHKVWSTFSYFWHLDCKRLSDWHGKRATTVHFVFAILGLDYLPLHKMPSKQSVFLLSEAEISARSLWGLCVIIQWSLCVLFSRCLGCLA